MRQDYVCRGTSSRKGGTAKVEAHTQSYKRVMVANALLLSRRINLCRQNSKIVELGIFESWKMKLNIA